MDQLCEVCGGSDFDLVDGLYYCSMCQSQSQHYREVVAERAYEENFQTNIALLHQTVNANASTSKKQTEEGQKNKEPLSQTAFYEVYTIFLKIKAKEFVSMGFPAILEKSVLRIWSMYLKKIGLWSDPSNDSEKNKQDNLETSSDQRDVGELEKNFELLGLIESAKKRPQAMGESRDMKALVLRLPLTICVLYIAILDCGLAFSFGDFLQLVLQQPRFFQDIFLKLPKKFQHPVIKHHFGTIVSFRLISLYKRCVFFAERIGFHKKVLVNFDDFMCRILYSLNLPASLLPRLIMVYKRVESQLLPLCFLETESYKEGYAHIPQDFWSVDLKCVGVLIITLKLVFGIDDEREYVLSEIASKSRHEILKFDFLRWLTQLKMRTAVLRGEPISNVLKTSWTYYGDGSMYQLEKDISESQRYIVSQPHQPRAYFDHTEKMLNIFTTENGSDGSQSQDRQNCSHFLLRDTFLLVPDEEKHQDKSTREIFSLFKCDFWNSSLDYLDSISENTLEELNCNKTAEKLVMGNVNGEIESPNQPNLIKGEEKEQFPCCRSYKIYDSNLFGTEHVLQFDFAGSKKFPRNFEALLNLLDVRLNEKSAILLQMVKKLENFIICGRGHTRVKLKTADTA